MIQATGRPRSLMLALGLAVVVLGSGPAQAQPRAPDGALVHRTLSRLGALDDYLVGIARGITADLVRASGQWTRAQVNGPYEPGGINVYLVDSRRLPESNPLPEAGVDLARSNLEGNAVTLEAPRLIMIDTVFLKSMVSAATLLGGPKPVDTINAVASLRAHGLDAFVNLWDPAKNAALSAPGPVDKWYMLYRGALAFVIAHELGHVSLGPREVVARSQARPFTGRDRDTYRACPLLVDPGHREKQAVEAEADKVAARLLAGVCAQLTPQQPRKFVYELGAQWYFVYTMGQGLVSALFATESRLIHTYMKTKLGADLYGAILKTAEREDRGSVQVFFPFTHPPDYRRAVDSLGQLRRLPCSYFYGEAESAEPQLLEQVRDRACREMAERYSR